MFFDYRQNNSGGGFAFDEDRGISVFVVVEAGSAQEADTRAEAVGLYFDGEGDCECCGSRWSSAWADDGTERPTIYGEPIDEYDFNDYKFMKEDVPEAFVHFADGRVQAYGFDTKTLAA